MSKIAEKYFNGEAVIAYILIAPAILVFSMFVFYPHGFSFFVSLNKWDMITKRQFLGLGNYMKLLQSPDFWYTMQRTVYYVGGFIPLVLVLSLITAIFLNNPLRGKRIYQVLIFLPMVTSTVAISEVFLWMYDPNFGLAGYVLAILGLPKIQFLETVTWALPAVIIVGLWLRLAFSTIVYLAGLQGIPTQLYDAAEIDGANWWHRFFFITLPQLRHITFLLLVVNTLCGFTVFTPIYVMTKGGPMNSTKVIMFDIYRNAFEYFRMGYATAMSFILFLIMFSLALIQYKFVGKES